MVDLPKLFIHIFYILILIQTDLNIFERQASNLGDKKKLRKFFFEIFSIAHRKVHSINQRLINYFSTFSFISINFFYFKSGFCIPMFYSIRPF